MSGKRQTYLRFEFVSVCVPVIVTGTFTPGGFSCVLDCFVHYFSFNFFLHYFIVNIVNINELKQPIFLYFQLFS